MVMVFDQQNAGRYDQFLFFSSTCAVISGMLQGSVLGPLLFLVYTSVIESVRCGNTALQLCADDAKLYS